MKKIILFFATGAGAGYLPKAPGTFGSVVGIILYLGLRYLSPVLYAVTVTTLILVACWISTLAETIFQAKDPQKIVIDEVVGMLVTLTLVPFSWQSVIAGFVLFRLFDIWKPFPVRWLQDHLPGGWGIVMDDVMAGIYANLLLRIVVRFL